MTKHIENTKFELDISEIIKRAVKYLLEGGAVALAARYIPSEKIDIREVAAIAFTAAYIDNDLIDEPLKARDWLEDMCKHSNKEVLDDWIILQSIY